MKPCPLKFTDKRGTEESTLLNDGKTISVELRGVRFAGEDFDSLSPDGGKSVSLAEKFSIHQDCLCDCELVTTMPISVIEPPREIPCKLVARIILGKPSEKGGLEEELVLLELIHPDARVASSGKSGWFDDELGEIQRNLPNGGHIRACIGCAYSDYSPYGHGLFGDMLCFRNLKAEYLAVTSKQEFWGVHDRFDRFVQETYCCDDFAERKPGTGYRG